jgi:hypothetical protein
VPFAGHPFVQEGPFSIGASPSPSPPPRTNFRALAPFGSPNVRPSTSSGRPATFSPPALTHLWECGLEPRECLCLASQSLCVPIFCAVARPVDAVARVAPRPPKDPPLHAESVLRPCALPCPVLAEGGGRGRGRGKCVLQSTMSMSLTLMTGGIARPGQVLPVC